MSVEPLTSVALCLDLTLAVAATGQPLQADIVDTKLVRDDSRKGLGHQGVTKGPGPVWYVTHNEQLFRYETDDFSAPQAQLIRNEKAFDHPDFEGTEFNHLGAPEHYQGNVYTFAKVGANPPMRLVWYDANELTYRGYRDIEIPKAPDGCGYCVSGGPHIVGERFYCALALASTDVEAKKSKVIQYIGQFRFPSAEFVKFLPLSGNGYVRPQGIDMDRQGNFYIAETSRGVHMYDSGGADRGTLFKHPKGGIHEGFYFDAPARTLTIAITRDGFYWITKVAGQDLNYLPADRRPEDG
jgi:hypothetical protein